MSGALVGQPTKERKKMYAWIAQQTIIDRFTKVHKRGPMRKEELQLWFESYADTEEANHLSDR